MSATKHWLMTHAEAIGGEYDLDRIADYAAGLPPGVLVRLAEPEDIPKVCELVGLLSPGKVHDYREAEKKFETHIMSNPDYYLWVVDIWEAGKVVDEVVATGMMHLQHKLSYHCGTAAHFEDLIVRPDYQGKRVGKAVVHTAITAARQHDCYKLMLTCYPQTASYYEQMGFIKHDLGMRLILKESLGSNEQTTPTPH